MRISDWSSDVCSSDLEYLVVDKHKRRAEYAAGVSFRPRFAIGALALFRIHEGHDGIGFETRRCRRGAQFVPVSRIDSEAPDAPIGIPHEAFGGTVTGREDCGCVPASALEARWKGKRHVVPPSPTLDRNSGG